MSESSEIPPQSDDSSSSKKKAPEYRSPAWYAEKIAEEEKRTGKKVTAVSASGMLFDYAGERSGHG